MTEDSVVLKGHDARPPMLRKAQADAKYREMTQGSVQRLILRLCIPAIISNLVTMAYNLADTFFIGHLGTAQSGAIGIAFSVMTILQAIGFFFGNGSGNTIARELGKHNVDRAGKLLSIGFFGSLLCGAVVAVLSLLTLRWLVVVLGSTSTIAPYAVEYLTPILSVSPLVCASFTMNGQLRYQGQSALGMYGLVSGALLNFIIAPVFIFVLGMGIFGAGLATAVCQSVAFLILLRMSLKHAVIRLSWRQCQPTVLLVREIMGGGLPSLVRQGAGSVAVTCVNIAANPFGDAAIAGMAIVMRIMMFANSMIIGLGQGFQPVCGYNFGAGLFARVKAGYWFCVRLSTAALVVMAVLMWFSAPHLIALFRSDPEVIAVGSLALRIQCTTVMLGGYNMMSNMMQQTMGKTGIASLLALCRLGLFLAPAVLLLPHLMGFLGVQAAQSFSDVLTFIVTIPLQGRVLRSLRIRKEKG
jgi:putative MATE family efflux protein